jgi:hypothetical protein
MKYFDIKFNKSFQIHCSSHSDLEYEKEYLFQIFEKPLGGKEYGYYGSCTLKPGFFYSFFRAFLGDIKVLMYKFGPSGLELIEEQNINFTNKKVRVDLITEDYFECTTWFNSVLEFRKKHSPSFITVKCNFPDRLREIYKNVSHNIEFLPYRNDECSSCTWGHFEIKKFDPKESGVGVYGEQWIKQDVGRLVEEDWRMFKSFKFPRDWNYISSEQFANDILGLISKEDLEFRGNFTDYEFFTQKDTKISKI